MKKIVRVKESDKRRYRERVEQQNLRLLAYYNSSLAKAG